MRIRVVRGVTGSSAGTVEMLRARRHASSASARPARLVALCFADRPAWATR